MLRSKALYINNVTSYNYMKTYDDNHKNEVNNAVFTYIVFSDYENTKHKHGDIFYNGTKITYINDVYPDFITDNVSYYMPFINSYGGLDFAKSYIYVEYGNNQIKESFSYNSVESPVVKLEHWTNFNDFVNITNTAWNYNVVHTSTHVNELDINETNGTLNIEKAQGVTELHSNRINISYDYTVQFTDMYGVEQIHTLSDFYTVKLNYNDPIEKLTIYDLPENFNVGMMYTPKILIEPFNSLSQPYWFSVDNTFSSYIDIDTYSGRFVCKKPRNDIKFKCTYYTNSEHTATSWTEGTFNIRKINSNISITCTYTSYIWDHPEQSFDLNYDYDETSCYYHTYPEMVPKYWEISYFINNSSDTTTARINNSNKYQRLKCTTTNSNDYIAIKSHNSYVLRAVFDDTCYQPSSASIMIWSKNYQANASEIYITDVAWHDTYITGVIVTVGEENTPNSNYKINYSGNFDNFTITDIVLGRSSNEYIVYSYFYADIKTDCSYGVFQIDLNDASSYSYSYYVSYDYDVENNIYTVGELIWNQTSPSTDNVPPLE